MLHFEGKDYMLLFKKCMLNLGLKWGEDQLNYFILKFTVILKIVSNKQAIPLSLGLEIILLSPREFCTVTLNRIRFSL